MAKRPMGFPTQNFVQGQVSGATPGPPGGGPGPQLQSSQAMAHTGDTLSTKFCGFDHISCLKQNRKNNFSSLFG